MADKDVQAVRQTGTLWTVSAVLGIIASLLLIITLIAVIIGIVILVPKISAALSLMGGGGLSQNQQYGGSNNTQGPSQADMQSFMQRMKDEVDGGNWEAAMADMNLFNSMSSQFPSDVQDAMHVLEQDIRNHDKASFDSHYGQFSQKYSQNSSSQGQNTQSGGSLLGSILSHIGASDYKVTYNMQASGNTITMTEYAKGGNTRYDMEVSGVSTEIFMLGDQAYSCTQIAGSFTCMKTGVGSVPIPAMSSMASSISNYAVTSLPDQYIANVAAKCFTLSSGSGGGNNGDYCFSNDGILLSLSSSSVSMTATSVERGVSDSVFELPASAS